MRSWSDIQLWEANRFRDQRRAVAVELTENFPRAVRGVLLDGWDNRCRVPVVVPGQGGALPHATTPTSSEAKAATEWLRGAAGPLEAARVGLAYDEEQIRAFAENYSRLCRRMSSRESRASFAVSVGVAPPAGKSITGTGAIARMDEPMWWRRQLRKAWTRAAEDGIRDAGMIRKGRQPYASDAAVEHRRARVERTREWMESRAMVNGAGEQLELLALSDRSLANPALRRGEFMCRMRGFETIAQDLGHVAEFVTLTTPSRFHAQLSGGGINPAWAASEERARVRDGQLWMRTMWARARAKLARLSVMFYGFRVAEPHHDATPHWHMVLFVAPANADAMRLAVRGCWLSEHGNDKGAAEHRVTFKRIEPEQGSATGYVAKYVSKNIDGAGAIGDEVSDETGETVSSGVARVAAWASVHGIRQFQQLGGPPVGVWRECRRLREPVDDADIERARAAADRGDWRGFIYALSFDHIKAGRRISVKVARVARGPGEKKHTGWFGEAAPEVNGYGEARPDRIIGVRCSGRVIVTRSHQWRIERKACAKKTLADRRASNFDSEISVCSDLGPVAITVRSAGEAAGDPSAWTSRETSMAGPH